MATNAQPQVAYYPVFYGSAVAPPPIQHVYYPSVPQHQWGGSTLPSPPAASAHQTSFFNHPYPPPPLPHHQSQAHYPATTSTYTPAYHVEIPPSSSVSVCDERANSPGSVYFQRNHESRMSGESVHSISPIQTRSIPHNNSSSSNIQLSTPANPLMEHSARYSTTSSTTSGFVSGAGESTVETPLNRPSAFSSLRTAFNKPKLYGNPEWQVFQTLG